jgi:hypothetical protein
MSNYYSQLAGCIHTGLNQEADEISWPAGPGKELFGASLLREATLRSALGPAPGPTEWPSYKAIFIYIFFISTICPLCHGSLSATDNAILKEPTDIPEDFFFLKKRFIWHPLRSVKHLSDIYDQGP